MSGAGHDRAKSKISGSETNSPNTTARVKPVSDGVGALFTYTRHYRRDPARQAPPLGVRDPLPQVSPDTCSGTASIWPLGGYTRRWDGKRGDDAAFRSDISAWPCHNRVATLLGCLLYAVQVALASELPSSSSDA